MTAIDEQVKKRIKEVLQRMPMDHPFRFQLEDAQKSGRLAVQLPIGPTLDMLERELNCE